MSTKIVILNWLAYMQVNKVDFPFPAVYGGC